MFHFVHNDILDHYCKNVHFRVQSGTLETYVNDDDHTGPEFEDYPQARVAIPSVDMDSGYFFNCGLLAQVMQPSDNMCLMLKIYILIQL